MLTSERETRDHSQDQVPEKVKGLAEGEQVLSKLSNQS